MFMNLPKYEPHSLNHFTDGELINVLRYSDNEQVSELVERFECYIDKSEETLKNEMQEARDNAADHVAEYAGEDYHGDIIKTLRNALKLNKSEMIETIKNVIEELEEIDKQAGEYIAAVRDGSAD